MNIIHILKTFEANLGIDIVEIKTYSIECKNRLVTGQNNEIFIS